MPAAFPLTLTAVFHPAAPLPGELTAATELARLTGAPLTVKSAPDNSQSRAEARLTTLREGNGGVTRTEAMWALALHPDGRLDTDIYVVPGLGGSWFGVGRQDDGELKIAWQRDFFDFGHVQKLYLDLMTAGKLSKGMQERIERSLAGEKLPGYYPLGQTPVPVF